jgi:hypothetical protein
VNNVDKLLRWIVGIVVVVFVVVAIVLFGKINAAEKKAERAQKNVTALYDYLKEDAPLHRARHHELCARIDTVSERTKYHKWGCGTTEVPKDPPPPQ